MNPTLPLDLLRSFVAVAETGVTCAADRVHRTQPAVSLQMKRLEHLVARHSDFDELGLGYLVDFPGSASFSN